MLRSNLKPDGCFNIFPSFKLSTERVNHYHACLACGGHCFKYSMEQSYVVRYWSASKNISTGRSCSYQ